MGWIRENDFEDDFSPNHSLQNYHHPQPKKPESKLRKAAKIGAAVVGGGLVLGAVGGALKGRNWRAKKKNTTSSMVKAAKALTDKKARKKALKRARYNIGYPRAIARGIIKGITSPVKHIKYLGDRVYRSTIGAWDD
jgi:hypothetical protein